jgi:hypothetical protein
VELARHKPAEAVLMEAFAAATESQRPQVALRLAMLYDGWGKPGPAAEWRAKYLLAATAPSKALSQENHGP